MATLEEIALTLKNIEVQTTKTNGRVTANEARIAIQDKNNALILQEIQHIKDLFKDHLHTFKDHTDEDKLAFLAAQKSDKKQEEKLNRWGGAIAVICTIVVPLVTALLLKYLHI